MVVGFDPVAKELVIDLGLADVPPITLAIDHLVVKYYDEDGILYCEMDDNGLIVGFTPIIDSTRVISLPCGTRRWMVILFPPRLR